MKNKLLSIVMGSLFVTALSVSAASAFGIDELLGSADLGNSGAAAELDLLQTLSGENNLTLDLSMTTTTAMVNGSDSWYLNVAPDQPGFFLLKFGTGGTTATADTFVFRNVFELDKLVWSNDQVQFLSGGGGCGNCNIERLSHYTYTGGDNPTQSTPEPGTIFLMGSGLAGLGFWRWKKGTKAQA